MKIFVVIKIFNEIIGFKVNVEFMDVSIDILVIIFLVSINRLFVEFKKIFIIYKIFFLEIV